MASVLKYLLSVYSNFPADDLAKTLCQPLLQHSAKSVEYNQEDQHANFTQLTYMRQPGSAGSSQNHNHQPVGLSWARNQGKKGEKVQGAESQENEEG